MIFNTIMTNNPFVNNVGKGEMLVTSISPFPTMFSTLCRTNFTFLVTFILLSAFAFKLVWSKILFFSKELKGKYCCIRYLTMLSAIASDY